MGTLANNVKHTESHGKNRTKSLRHTRVRTGILLGVFGINNNYIAKCNSTKGSEQETEEIWG